MPRAGRAICVAVAWRLQRFPKKRTVPGIRNFQWFLWDLISMVWLIFSAVFTLGPMVKGMKWLGGLLFQVDLHSKCLWCLTDLLWREDICSWITQSVKMLQLFVFNCSLVTFFHRAEVITQIQPRGGVGAVAAMKQVTAGCFFSVPKLKRLKHHITTGLPKLSTFAWMIVECWTGSGNPHKAAVHGWPQCLPVFNKKRTPCLFHVLGSGDGWKTCFCQSHLGQIGREALFYMSYNMPKKNNQVLMGRVGRRGVAIITVCELSKDCWDFFTFLGHVKGHICCLPKKHYWRLIAGSKFPPFFLKENAFQEVMDFSLLVITTTFHDLTASRC